MMMLSTGVEPNKEKIVEIFLDCKNYGIPSNMSVYMGLGHNLSRTQVCRVELHKFWTANVLLATVSLSIR